MDEEAKNGSKKEADDEETKETDMRDVEVDALLTGSSRCEAWRCLICTEKARAYDILRYLHSAYNVCCHCGVIHLTNLHTLKTTPVVPFVDTSEGADYLEPPKRLAWANDPVEGKDYSDNPRNLLRGTSRLAANQFYVCLTGSSRVDLRRVVLSAWIKPC